MSSASDRACSIAERGQRRVALVGERGQHDERDRAGPDDVERQHRGREPMGDGRGREEQLARDAEEHERAQEPDEPADRLPHLEEDERSERREDPPQPDPAGGKEATGEHLPDGRRQEDVEELRREERAEPFGPGEDQQRAERHGEVDERDDADRRSEREVARAPDDRDGQDQDGEQNEQRLLLAQILVVPRVSSDPGQPGRRPHRRILEPLGARLGPSWLDGMDFDALRYTAADVSAGERLISACHESS